MSRLKKDIGMMILIVLLFILLIAYLQTIFSWIKAWSFLPFLPVAFSLYIAIVFQKRFEKVKKWKGKLGLDEEDLIHLSGAEPYQIPKWEKKDLSLSWPKMSRLTDKVERMVNNQSDNNK